MKKNSLFRKVITFLVILNVSLPYSYASSLSIVPAAPLVSNKGVMTSVPTLKGVEIDPERALRIDFIIDEGGLALSSEELEKNATQFAKYFLAALTIPETDQWVNLSPLEPDRIATEALAQTAMGQELLAQDYMLKQITSALIDPQDELGSRFWNEVFQKAYTMYGTTEIPLENINRVWIVPEKAVVYEKDNGAYVLDAVLDVKTEQDYMMAQGRAQSPDYNVSADVMRELVIPVLKDNINHAPEFAKLRQIYHAMILATWYKTALKQSLLVQHYADQKHVQGIAEQTQDVHAIYQQYLASYRDGVFNLIKEDVDLTTGDVIPRHYFSGGFVQQLSQPGVMQRYNQDTLGTSPEYGQLRHNAIGVARAQRTTYYLYNPTLHDYGMQLNTRSIAQQYITKMIPFFSVKRDTQREFDFNDVRRYPLESSGDDSAYIEAQRVEALDWDDIDAHRDGVLVFDKKNGRVDELPIVKLTAIYGARYTGRVQQFTFSEDGSRVWLFVKSELDDFQSRYQSAWEDPRPEYKTVPVLRGLTDGTLKLVDKDVSMEVSDNNNLPNYDQVSLNGYKTIYPVFQHMGSLAKGVVYEDEQHFQYFHVSGMNLNLGLYAEIAGVEKNEIKGVFGIIKRLKTIKESGKQYAFLGVGIVADKVHHVFWSEDFLKEAEEYLIMFDSLSMPEAKLPLADRPKVLPAELSNVKSISASNQKIGLSRAPGTQYTMTLLSDQNMTVDTNKDGVIILDDQGLGANNHKQKRRIQTRERKVKKARNGHRIYSVRKAKNNKGVYVTYHKPGLLRLNVRERAKNRPETALDLGEILGQSQGHTQKTGDDNGIVAANKTGGIDLNPVDMAMEIKRDQAQALSQITVPQLMPEHINFDLLQPVFVGAAPVNFPGLLGFLDQQNEVLAIKNEEALVEAL